MSNHKFLLVSTDIFQNGDLFCIEILSGTRVIQFASAIVWLEMLIIIIIWNFFIIGRRAAINLQLLQPLFILYPILKFGHCITGAMMMAACTTFEKREGKLSDAVNSLLKYTYLIHITFQMINYTVFFGLQYIFLCGFGTIKQSLSRTEFLQAMAFVFGSYILHSSYLITQEGTIFNTMVKFALLLFHMSYLYQSAIKTRTCLKTIKVNINYLWDISLPQNP